MAITSSNLKIFASVNMPQDDSSVSGGSIDKTTTVKNMLLIGNTIPKVKSTSASDITQIFTIVGRNASGAIITKNVTLNGTTLVAFVDTFSEILIILVNAATVGKVELYENNGTTLIVSLDSDDTTNAIKNNLHPFYGSAPDADDPIIRYEKIYVYNDHDTLTHVNAKAAVLSDPENVIRIGLEQSANESVANRLTAPSEVVFTDEEIDLGNIPPNSGIGIWIEKILSAGHTGFFSKFQLRYRGNSI